MRILRPVLIAALACMLTTCASVGPPLPPSLELPKPPADLHAVRKGSKVTLTWTVPTRTTDRRIVRYLGETEVCRGLEPVLGTCGKPVGEVSRPANIGAAKEAKSTASFVDSLSQAIEEEHPSGFATYAVEVMNTSGRGAGLSNQVHVPLMATLPPVNDFSARVSPEGVWLSWKCTENAAAGPSGVKYLFRIYRRPVSENRETKIADIDATRCATRESLGPTGQPAGSGINVPAEPDTFLDRNFEWEKTYIYQGTVVSVMAVPGRPPVEVEGDDTPEVKVFADDVFPPAVPAGLQAVFSGPGQQPFIDLIWTPDTDADLAGYNIYRREDGGTAVRLNSELAKAPAFRDTNIQAGKTYYYSVSAVDLRGNESARSEEASERVP